MNEIAKNWKWHHIKNDVHSNWGNEASLTRAISDCKLQGDHWDLFDPDTGACVHRSMYSKAMPIPKHNPRIRKALLCGALVATLTGCGYVPPDALVRPQHIEFATKTCATNGGLKWIKSWSYSASFECNNELWGVVPRTYP